MEHKAVPYLAKYPEISRAAQKASELIKTIVPLITHLHGHIEPETRLGKVQKGGNGSFISGVNRHVYEQSLQLIQTFPNWTKVSGPNWIHDYFYDFPAQHTRPQYPQQIPKLLGSSFRPASQIRTSVTFFDHEAEPCRKIQHVYKHSLGQLTFQYSSSTGSATPAEGTKQNHPCDVRMSINWEEDVRDIPDAVLPKFVRIKHRKSFVYTPEHFTKPIWSFDFTRSWSGTTKEEAELAQKQVDPIYEIECECLDMMAYMDNSDHDELFLATSMLLKMRDIIGIASPYTLVPM
jgi:hypothetical protein